MGSSAIETIREAIQRWYPGAWEMPNAPQYFYRIAKRIPASRTFQESQPFTESSV
jgi:hypothetical protein